MHHHFQLGQCHLCFLFRSLCPFLSQKQTTQPCQRSKSPFLYHTKHKRTASFHSLSEIQRNIILVEKYYCKRFRWVASDEDEGKMASQSGGGGRVAISYKKATIVICSSNLVLALYVLYSVYASFYVFSDADNAASVSFGVGKYTDEQIRKMKESIRIRQASEPVELVKLVKEMEEEFSVGSRVLELSSAVKRSITHEVLQRLKELKPNANVSEQRACLDIWRKQKLQELKLLVHENMTSNSTSAAEEANSLVGILESDWMLLMEHIGVWLPPEAINKETDDKPTNEDTEEEDIIPGRPVPPECHAEQHTDYDGAAVRWGLTHHKESAADCCKACLDQAKRAKPGELKCNIWVYCPSETGCYSPDKYEHKHQECWLKQAHKPRLNFKDTYSEVYRSSHPTAPLIVPWMSGVVSV